MCQIIRLLWLSSFRLEFCPQSVSSSSMVVRVVLGGCRDEVVQLKAVRLCCRLLGLAQAS